MKACFVPCALALLGPVAAAQNFTWTAAPGGPHTPIGLPQLASVNFINLQVAPQSRIVLESVPDLTGDTRRDLAVGLPDLDQVRIYNPRNGGLLYTIQGPVAGSEFGYSLAVGDLQGDGVPDLIVGAPTFPQVAGPALGAPGSAGGGAVYRYSLTPGTEILNNSWGSSLNAVFPVLPAGTPGQVAGGNGPRWYGTSVAITADNDGNGFLDVLVGDPGVSQLLQSNLVVDRGWGEVVSVLGPPFAAGLPPEILFDGWIGTSGEMGRGAVGVPDVDGDGAGESFLLADASNLGRLRNSVLGIDISQWNVGQGAGPSGLGVDFLTGSGGEAFVPIGLYDDPIFGVQPLDSVSVWEVSAVGGPTVFSSVLAPAPTNNDDFLFGFAVSSLSFDGTVFDFDGANAGTPDPLVTDYVVGAPYVGAGNQSGRAFLASAEAGTILSEAIVAPNLPAPTAGFGCDVSEIDILGMNPFYAVSDCGSGIVHVFF